MFAAVMPGRTRIGMSANSGSRARSSNSSPAIARMPGSPEQTMQTSCPAAAASSVARHRATSPIIPFWMIGFPMMRSRMKST